MVEWVTGKKENLNEEGEGGDADMRKISTRSVVGEARRVLG